VLTGEYQRAVQTGRRIDGIACPAPEPISFFDLPEGLTTIACTKCGRMGRYKAGGVALAPFVNRFGPDASSDVLRRSARCSRCGSKGATLQHPSWAGSQIGFQPFPVGRVQSGEIKREGAPATTLGTSPS
jgi:hypothetical protein